MQQSYFLHMYSEGLVEATLKLITASVTQGISYTQCNHPSASLLNSNSNHLHAAESLQLTGHLWYADGPAAGAIAPFSQSFDLNEVVLSGGDVELHTGLIGFQYRSPAVPVLTIHHLEGSRSLSINISSLISVGKYNLMTPPHRPYGS